MIAMMWKLRLIMVVGFPVVMGEFLSKEVINNVDLTNLVRAF
jgi:hypothetical protein